MTQDTKARPRLLDAREIAMVGGGMRNLAQYAPGYNTPKLPPRLGQGEVDGIPWGGAPGDGSWGTVNNNLPG